MRAEVFGEASENLLFSFCSASIVNLCPLPDTFSHLFGYLDWDVVNVGLNPFVVVGHGLWWLELLKRWVSWKSKQKSEKVLRYLHLFFSKLVRIRTINKRANETSGLELWSRIVLMYFERDKKREREREENSSDNERCFEREPRSKDAVLWVRKRIITLNVCSDDVTKYEKEGRTKEENLRPKVRQKRNFRICEEDLLALDHFPTFHSW